MSSRRWRHTKRWLRAHGRDAVVIGSAVVATGVLSVLAFQQPEVPDGPGAPLPEPTLGKDHPALTMAFVGDSYTAGAGTEAMTLAEGQAEGYAGLTADILGARAIIDGQGGTGYLNPGDDKGETTYLPRAREVRGQPDVIVVQGSGNDLVMSGDLRPAVDRVLEVLHTEHPKAELVVLGPVDAPGLEASAAEVASEVATLQAAAKDAGARFVDARDWLPRDNLYIDDMVHPNPEGHAVMARRLADVLRRS